MPGLVACFAERETPMSQTLAVAVVQTTAHDRVKLQTAWPSIRERIIDAARSGAGLIVLPEGTLPAYVLGYERFEESEIAGALDECRRLAAGSGAVLVIGAARREGNRVFNSALVIDADGSIAGSADKHFLWHFDRQWFEQGERLEPVRTSAGVIGALVCADGRIPTIARTLVDRGAQILVMPTAWVTSGRDPANLENIQADLLGRIRARENGVPFVAANKCGVELGCVAYCGKSQIARADGSIAAIAPERSEQTLIATIDLPDALPARATMRPAAAAPALPRTSAVRIAVAARDFGDAALLAERMRILEAGVFIDARTTAGEEFSTAQVTDGQLFDPGFLAVERLSGQDFAVWRTASDPQWQVHFARARALELRMYVCVIDASRERAFAVDPDGAIVCGTFDGYEIASFTYDPMRTQQTFVAPGTDVRAGLQRAYQHASR